MNGKIFYGLIRRAVCCVAVLALSCSAVTAFASVTSTKSATGAANDVYVAGNPDFYPIEYYDAESNSYKGVIPKLLKKVSKATGRSFVYISAGEKNEQKRLSRNNQAELITAILSDDTECTVDEKYPVIRIKSNGKDKTVCIGFTKVASDELVESVKNALSQISEEEKMGLVVSSSAEYRPMPKTRLWTYIGVSFFGAVLITVIVVLIIKSRKKKKNRLNDMIDALTGVGNDQYYVYAFDSLIAEQARNLYNVAYIAFDAEKAEDLFGSKTCDDIQKYAAAHLNSAAGSSEYLSRIQSGAFAFAFQAESKERTVERAKEVVSGLNQYLAELNADWSRIFYAGICRLADCPDCNAETALYNAKQGFVHAKSKNLLCYMGSEHQLAEIRKHAKLCSQVNSAIEHGQFRIYMQLITKSDTESICGAEVLSRWQNPYYGMLKPNEYIDILIETGKIVRHDYNVFDSVCRRLECWSEPPFDNLFLTCNFTRESLSQSDFSEKIRAISERYNFDHERLVIEITEDSLGTNSEVTTKNINTCSEMGFKIAIDDMGTGFSSLSDLYENKIDIVKIEKDLVGECTSERRYKLLSGIVSLAHSINAKVICEGIESQEQQKIVKKTGCDMMQGFLYSRVLPISECEKYIISKSTVKEPI